LATDRLFCHYAPERDLLAALQALNKEHARKAKGAKRDIWWLHLPWPQPVYTKGSACAGFDLRVQGTGSKRTVREFTDENGNTRTIAAGKGWNLTFTNDFSGKSVVVPSRGSVTDFKVFPGPPDDGESLTGRRTLHNAGTFFLVLSRPTFRQDRRRRSTGGGEVYLTSRDDEGAIWRRQRASGRTTDICAVLA
jgi:hypothetical protein